MNRRVWLPGLVAAVVICLPLRAGTVTIFSITGPPDSYISGSLTPMSAGVGGLVAMGWTATSDYVNVAISADIESTAANQQTVTAFLTTQVGAGTTIADQVATTTIPIAPGTSAFRDLFSGLALPSGEYWLTLISSDTTVCFWCGSPEIGWESRNAATPTLDAGVTWLGYWGGTPGAYPPAFTSLSNGGLQMEMSVTGDLGSGVPEPASTTLLALGLTALCCIRRRSIR